MTKYDIVLKNNRFQYPGNPETYEQQYSSLYTMRINQIRPLLVKRMKNEWNTADRSIVPKILDLLNSSSENTSEEKSSFVVGCLCKESPIRASFLEDYTKYVIPSTLEVEAQEDGDIADLMTSFSENKINTSEMESKLADMIGKMSSISADGLKDGESQSVAEAYAYLMNLYRKEKIWFEDESGRVEIEVHGDHFATKCGINPLEVVTGLVVAAEGKMDAHSGKFVVSRWMFAGVNDVQQLRHLSPQTHSLRNDRYIAFVSTLSCEALAESNESCAKKHKGSEDYNEEHFLKMLLQCLKSTVSTQNEARSISNNISSPSKGIDVHQVCENIEHVIVCGGLIPDINENQASSTESNSVFEIAQRRSQIRLDSEETAESRDTIALNMQKADEFIRDLIDESDIETERIKRLTIIPSHSDPTNHFYPQQPLYPFCIPKTAKLRREKPGSCWNVDLVTNPCHFLVNCKKDEEVHASQPKVSILGSSGENIQDCIRYSHNLISEIDWIERTLLSRHICPTSPDTLPCLPYCVKGTKKFGSKLGANAPLETGVISDPFCLVQSSDSAADVPDVFFAGGCNSFATRYLPNIGRRLIAVPKFSKTHSFCVMNIDSPTLETFEVCLSMNIKDEVSA